MRILSSFVLLGMLSAPALANEGHAHKKTTLTVTSPAFAASEAMPPEYTCDGDAKPPPLAWSNIPAETKSIAIMVEDPDAPQGTFTHWIVTNISPKASSLAAGAALPAGAVAAKNDKGMASYAAPCPASGTHHYVFHVYALDTGIATFASRADFLEAIDGHVIADGELVATYKKTL